MLTLRLCILFLLLSIGASLSVFAQSTCPSQLTCNLDSSGNISCGPTYSNYVMRILSTDFPSGKDVVFTFNHATALVNGGPVSCNYALSTNPNLQNVQLTTTTDNFIPTPGSAWKTYDPSAGSKICQGDVSVCTYTTK